MALLSADFVKPIVALVYAGVAAVGLLFVVLGFVFMGEIGVGGFSAVMILVGVVLLLLAGLVTFANNKRSWTLVGLGFVIALCLCFLLMVMSMGALLIASSTMDPIGTAVEKAWENGLRKELEMSNTDDTENFKSHAVFCHVQTPENGYCSKFYAELAQRGPTCTEHKGMYAYNCSLGCSTFKQGLCKQCDDECEQAFTDKVRSAIRPLTIIAFVTCIFAFFVMMLNAYYVTSEGTRKSPLGMAALGINGLITVLGIAIVVTGAIIIHSVQSECPVGQDCDSMAMLFVVMTGLFMVVSGFLAFFGLWKQELMIVKCANTMLAVMALLMLIATIILGFASGLLDTLKEMYDDPEVYEQTRKAVDASGEFCKCTLADCDDSSVVMPARKHCGCVEGEALTKEQCKGKMEVATEDNLRTIGIVMAIVMCLLLGITWFTYEAMAAYRADAMTDEEEYDDEDDYKLRSAPLEEEDEDEEAEEEEDSEAGGAATFEDEGDNK